MATGLGATGSGFPAYQDPATSLSSGSYTEHEQSFTVADVAGEDTFLLSFDPVDKQYCEIFIDSGGTLSTPTQDDFELVGQSIVLDTAAAQNDVVTVRYRAPVSIVTATAEDGRSAYEVAVSNGFVGTEEDWLSSLVGPAGEDGSTLSYSSRSAAEAVDVPADATNISVNTPAGGVLTYVRADQSDDGIALTTNGGASYWKPPHGHVSPQHYAENTTAGVTDMTAAVKSALKFVSYGVVPNNTFGMHGPASDLETRRVDLMGENLGVSSPIIVGDLDTNLNGFMDKIGSGIMAGTVIENGSLVALSNFDTTSLATFNHGTQGVVETVPAYVLVMGTYDTYDRDTTMQRKSYVTRVYVRINIDCGFVTGGVYLENTRKCVLEDVAVVNMGQDKVGILTSVQNTSVAEPNLLGHYNVRGVETKNTELYLIRPQVSGRNREAGATYPAGLVDEVGQNATGIKILCADTYVINPVTTATAAADIVFDCFNNGQFTGAHPWGAGGIIFGPDCEGITGENIYLDHSDLIFYSFEHSVSNIAARAGDANVRLVATTAAENALNLIINGLNANGASTLVYDVDATLDAGASWAADDVLYHTLSEVNIEAAHSFKEYVPESHYVTSAGASHYLTNQINLDQFSSSQTTIGAKRGIILGADVDDNSSGDARKISFQSRGVERAFIDHAEAQFNVPITGDAVQANKTDTTGGRLMSVGAFGLGSVTPPVVTDLDEIDRPAGFYSYNAGAISSPNGQAGYFIQLRRFGGAIEQAGQIAFDDNGNGVFLRYTTGGSYKPWQTLYATDSILSPVSMNGSTPVGGIIEQGADYVKFAGGTMIATVKLTLTQTAANKVEATWTYPQTFVGAPSISGTIDRNTVASGATPNPEELTAIMTASEGNTSSIIEVYRIAGATDFVSGDTLEVRLTASGYWN